MEYWEIRKKFIEISGRYDLISATDFLDPTTWIDNGADFYLNMGQKVVDRRLDSGKMIARYPFLLTAGTVVVKTPGIRAIKEVWIANADGRSRLSPIPIAKFRAGYAADSASLDRDIPLYYAPAAFRPFPDELASTVGLNDVEDLLLSGTHYNYNGVIVMPPPISNYTITIWGLFYSPTLSAVHTGSVWVQTKSFWTENAPETLLEAALSRLATYAGNITSAKEHKEAMLEDVRDLDFDAVEETLSGDMEMESD